MPRDFLLVRLVAWLRYSGIRTAKLLSAIAVSSALAYASPTLAAASLSDDAVWLATQAALLKIPKAEAQIALTLDSGNAPQTVAIDEVTGRTWVYSKRQLRSFGFDGAVLSRTLLPRSSGDDDANGDSDDRQHVALVVDPAHGSIYLARHKTLYCFASDGTLINTTALADSVRGMAIDRTAGALFVAGKTNVAVYTSQLSEALNFSSGTEDIRAIDFDPALAQLWVATHQSLRRYTATGQHVFHLALGKIAHLAADGQGAVWAVREKKLNRIDASGLLLLDARLAVGRRM